ncbi:MAG: hypothetical protein IJ744_05415 [Lachnospiraceae bacterium]|nr:hypothetical protein [Lachnospiraceae bacterium]
MEGIDRLEKKVNHLIILSVFSLILMALCFALLLGRRSEQEAAVDLPANSTTDQRADDGGYASEQEESEETQDYSDALYRDSRLLENATEATVNPEEIMIGDDLDYELRNPETNGSKMLAIAFYFTSYESEEYLEGKSEDPFMKLLHVPLDYQPEVMEEKYYKNIRERLEKQLGITIEKKTFFFYRIANEDEVDPYDLTSDEANLFKDMDTRDKVITHSEIWYIAYLTKDEVLQIIKSNIYLNGDGFRMDLAPDFMGWGTELIDESQIYDP